MGVPADPAAAPSVPDVWALCLAGEPAVRPETLVSAWSLAPATTGPILIGAIAMAVVLQRAARGSSRAGRSAACALGFAWLAVALVSPLCRLAATLASAHMIQHVVLVTLAPSALVFAVRGMVFLGRPPGIGALCGATLAKALVIWGWHSPALYEAALLDPSIHLVQIATLLTASVAYWYVIVTAPTRLFGVVALVLLVTMIHTGLLGALLTFAPSILYPVMIPGAGAFALSPLADQQLAGLIMWVPMGGLYFLAALAVIARGLTAAGAPAATRSLVSGTGAPTLLGEPDRIRA